MKALLISKRIIRAQIILQKKVTQKWPMKKRAIVRRGLKMPKRALKMSLPRLISLPLKRKSMLKSMTRQMKKLMINQTTKKWKMRKIKKNLMRKPKIRNRTIKKKRPLMRTKPPKNQR